MVIGVQEPNHTGLGVFINAWPEAKRRRGSIAEARIKLCDHQKLLVKRERKVKCLHRCMYNLFRGLLLYQ